VTSSVEPNPPITVTIVPIVAPGQELPSMAVIGADLSGGETWGVDGVQRDYTRGVIGPSSVIDPEGVRLYMTDPPGWSASDISCSGGAPGSVLERIGWISVRVDLDQVDPGSDITCEVDLVPASTVITVDLVIDFGDAEPVPVSYARQFFATTVIPAGETGSFQIGPDGAFSLYPIAGFALGHPQCAGARIGNWWEGNGAVGARLQYDPGDTLPARIECVVPAAPMPPARITIRSEIAGAVGNGDLEFEATAIGFAESVVFDGAGVATIEVPATSVELVAQLPVTWRNGCPAPA
jgi:hypothetical protein